MTHESTLTFCVLLLLTACAYSYSYEGSGRATGTSKGASVIEPELLDTFDLKSNADILIEFSGTSQVLADLKKMKFADRRERLQAINTALVNNAKTSQEMVIAFLNASHVDHKSLWISNTIFIKAASLDLVQELTVFSEITKIKEDKVVAKLLIDV